METISRNIVTLSIIINCSYDVAFTYLSSPINQKEWAIHFFEDIEDVNGQVVATLPFGKLPLNVKSDYESGVLDIYLGDGQPTRTRLIEIEKGLIVYNFTLAQPKNMPDELWANKALIDMKDELNILKSILENK